MARGVGRIVVDIPYHSIQRSALLVLRELITGLRGDADPGGRP